MKKSRHTARTQRIGSAVCVGLFIVDLILFVAIAVWSRHCELSNTGITHFFGVEVHYPIGALGTLSWFMVVSMCVLVIVILGPDYEDNLFV